MKNLLKLSAIAILAASAVSTFASNKEPYTEQGTNAREMTEQKPIHWISVEQLKKELEGKAPINVSFDIDDTVLFSSPCFYHGQEKYSPGKNDYLKNQDFWNEVNAGCDQYSIPKQKTPGIIEHKVSIHYGDSDDDILAAKEAGIRGIRLMRAANSTYQPMPTLGGYGEEVLINSNY